MIHSRWWADHLDRYCQCDSMSWFTYLTVLINLCLTLSIGIIDDAVKVWHSCIFVITLSWPQSSLMSLLSPPPPLPTHFAHPLLLFCISSNSQSVQITSRSCNSTTRPIYWPVEQELLTPSVPWSGWDTQSRWVPRTEFDLSAIHLSYIFKSQMAQCPDFLNCSPTVEISCYAVFVADFLCQELDISVLCRQLNFTFYSFTQHSLFLHYENFV